MTENELNEILDILSNKDKYLADTLTEYLMDEESGDIVLNRKQISEHRPPFLFTSQGLKEMEK